MIEHGFLLDVNVLIALLDDGHIHHDNVSEWFNQPGLRWFLCAFTEAAFVRIAASSHGGGLSVREASRTLKDVERYPGYEFLRITTGWNTTCAPFIKRLQGSKQVTDAYLLGLAVWNDLVLVTLDKSLVHLAGEDHGKHVLLLGPATRN